MWAPLAQRVYGLALGYEDLDDHDDLRRDPLLAAIVGKPHPPDTTAAPPLRRQEHAQSPRPPVGADEGSRYKKITCCTRDVERLFVTSSSRPTRPPERIVLDLDATDDPIHGHQRAASSTPTTGATATCRCTSSAATTSCRPAAALGHRRLRRLGEARERIVAADAGRGPR